AETCARLTDAALKNSGYIQATSNGSQIDMLPFERECGSPRYDTNVLDLGKRIDDLLSDAVCEELIFRIRAHVGEGQDDNGLMLSPGWHRREGPCLPFTERFSESVSRFNRCTSVRISEACW